MNYLTLLIAGLFFNTAFAGNGHIECDMQLKDRNQYSIKIQIVNDQLTILQSSRVARYAMISGTVTPVDYTYKITEPELFCEQTWRGGYRIEILKKDNILQVFQASPQARYAPLEFQIEQ